MLSDDALEAFGSLLLPGFFNVDLESRCHRGRVLADQHGEERGQVRILLLRQVARSLLLLRLLIVVVFGVSVESSDQRQDHGQKNIGNLFRSFQESIERAV